MIREEMLFPKSSPQTESCEPMVYVMGFNMGICLILTAIVAIAAILGCVLLLICVKMATDRDENRRMADENENSRKRSIEDGVSSSISANTDTAVTARADERLKLTGAPIYGENDI